MVRRALAIAAALGGSGAALGAEVTHVATAATATWPIEIDASVGFEGTIQQADIAKEQFQTTNGTSTLIKGTEMSYQSSTTVIPIRVAAGIWHDLELHVMVPLIISYDQSWSYSSLSNNGANDTVNKPAGICAEGPSSSCGNGLAPGGAWNTLVPSLPIDSNRGGFVVGNIAIGAAWTPLSEADDHTLPTWLLGFDYIAPTASPMDPTVTSYDSNGSTQSATGDGLHHFHPYTAMSKRQGVFDPYVTLWLDFAHAMGNTYDNCNHPIYSGTNDPRVNCGVAPFTTDVTRLQPEYQGGISFGTEIVPYEDVANFQKVAFALRFISEYHSQARTYTQLSDLLQELTEQQDYARLGGEAGIAFHAGKYFKATAGFTLVHDTDHWLTNENLGAPNSPAGTQINVDTHVGQNPNFDFRFDNPGSRFLLQSSIIGTLSVQLTAMF